VFEIESLIENGAEKSTMKVRKYPSTFSRQ